MYPWYTPFSMSSRVAKTDGAYKETGKGKSNVHAEEDFTEKLESINLDPCLSNLILKYHEVFGVLPPPLSGEKLVQLDLIPKPDGDVRLDPSHGWSQICNLDRQKKVFFAKLFFEKNEKRKHFSWLCSPLS